MVICSPSVKNVLDRLFLNATTMGRTPVEYNNCIQALHRIESGILRTMAKQPLSWARSHLFVVKTSRYWFGYVIINDIPIVEEVFDSRTNTILTEMLKKQITITESEIKWMVKECISKLVESAKIKRVGQYTAIDGSWWDGYPHGLEMKGAIQDVRMYDQLHSDGRIDTIALFRRCDNRKFFYARIVPIDGSKETKWEPIPLSNVPKIIKQDRQTINPQGHEPYLPF